MSNHRIKWEYDSDIDDYSYNVVDAVARIQGYTGATYQNLRIDPATFSLQVIDFMDYEVHAGHAFVVSQRSAVDAFDILSPLSFYIITPNTTKHSHIALYGEANLPAYWELFEDTGNAAEFNVSGGSTITPINRNRNSDITSTLTITTGPTITAATAAALIATEATGKAGGDGKSLGFVLKKNTKYLARATSYLDNNEGSFRMKWHEHTDLE